MNPNTPTSTRERPPTNRAITSTIDAAAVLLPVEQGGRSVSRGESHHVDHHTGCTSLIGPRSDGQIASQATFDTVIPAMQVLSSNVPHSTNPSPQANTQRSSQNSSVTTTQGTDADHHSEFIRAVLAYVERWVCQPWPCADEDIIFRWVLSDEPQTAIDMIDEACSTPFFHREICELKLTPTRLGTG
jgi:hypothetical protein